MNELWNEEKQEQLIAHIESMKARPLEERVGLIPKQLLRVDDAMVMITVFDSPPKIKETVWTPFEDKGRELGLVLVEMDGEYRVFDVDGQDRPQRWWKVMAMAQMDGKQTVPIYWQGPARELPEKYTKVDPEKPDRLVMVRMATSGPWARIELAPA
jgi:hypothetical protein